MSDELNECPFCGKEPKVIDDGCLFFWVRCTNLYCKVHPKTTLEKTRKKAIEVWNRREERTCEVVKDVFDWKCSECGKVITEQVNYCPSCGARVVK